MLSIQYLFRMTKAQYRKYKEIYQIDLDILKLTIKDCDAKINEINISIDKKNKKQFTRSNNFVSQN